MSLPGDPPKRRTLTESSKEQIKLRGAWLNGLAIGCFVAGVPTSTLATVLDPAQTLQRQRSRFAMLICFRLSIVLHLYAVTVL